MLYTDVNEFNWSIDTLNATLTDVAGFGVDVVTGAANTKGTETTLLAGGSVTEDVYGIAIYIVGGQTAGARRSFLTDIFIDSVLTIPDLLGHQNGGSLLGVTYYFPLFIKAGSAISAKSQCNAATITHRIAVKLYGKPTHPELIRTGSKVEAIGVDTANTLGVAVTPGTAAWGSWTSIGATTQDNWWWQWGLTCTDTTMGIAHTVGVGEVKVGNGTNDKTCIELSTWQVNTLEHVYKSSGGVSASPIKSATSGETAYSRLLFMGTPDTGVYITVYGMK